MCAEFCEYGINSLDVFVGTRSETGTLCKSKRTRFELHAELLERVVVCKLPIAPVGRSLLLSFQRDLSGRLGPLDLWTLDSWTTPGSLDPWILGFLEHPGALDPVDQRPKKALEPDPGRYLIIVRRTGTTEENKAKNVFKNRENA